MDEDEKRRDRKRKRSSGRAGDEEVIRTEKRG